MSKDVIEKEGKVLKPVRAEGESGPAAEPGAETGGVLGLQQKIGNRAVQRLLAQRDDGGLELDDETAGRINEARGGGQGLDAGLQEQMGTALGHDLSGVQVHTDTKADTLSRELNAEAFTTGQDVFFRQGAYDSHSGGGRELIAHELTHVVQQGTGAVSSTQGMTVNPPDDVYEQEADAVAQQVAHAGAETATAGAAGGTAQRQEEDEVQFKRIQRQVAEEEEEPAQLKAVQRQVAEEEEEPAQLKAVQRQVAEEEEEPAQLKAVQRQEEPEEEEEEEEPVQAKAVQRQEETEEEEI
jgi:hypothetical protein